jgi:hypothetical protein
MPETIATMTPKASENVKLNPPKPFYWETKQFRPVHAGCLCLPQSKPIDIRR